MSPHAFGTLMTGTFTRADTLQIEAADHNAAAVGSRCVKKCQDCGALYTGPVDKSGLYPWSSDIKWNRILFPIFLQSSPVN